jgi:rhamnogalacturonan endolyase
MAFFRVLSLAFLVALLGLVQAKRNPPFLRKESDLSYVIGNDLWSLTVGPIFGKKLLYKGVDLVGNASGHYVSYSESASFFCIRENSI